MIIETIVGCVVLAATVYFYKEHKKESKEQAPTDTGSAYQGVYSTTISRHPTVADGAGYLAGVANFKVNADGSVSNETPTEGSVILHGYRSEIGAGSKVDANGNFNLNFNVIGTVHTGATASGTISSTGVVSGNAYEAGHLPATAVGIMVGKRNPL